MNTQSSDVPLQKSVKPKLSTLTKIKRTLLITAGFIIAVMLIAGLTAECTIGDVCVEKRIEGKRSEKQGYEQRIAVIDSEIEGLKKEFTAGYVVEKIKSGDTKQVSKDLLGFKTNLKILPQAFASTTDQGSLSTPDVTISTPEINPDDFRYQAFLTSVGSPFASTPIGKYCREGNVTVMQCNVLVGISGAESGFGTNFVKKDQATGQIVRAVEEGTQKYNPVGLKGGNLSYPTEDGFYLRPFASWDDFWSQYPSIMKKGYFDKGASEPETISRWYVGGNGKVKSGWSEKVKQTMQKLPNS